MDSPTRPQVLGGEGLEPERLLQVVPSKGFPELRALLLERLGQHADALRCPWRSAALQ